MKAINISDTSVITIPQYAIIEGEKNNNNKEVQHNANASVHFSCAFCKNPLYHSMNILWNNSRPFCMKTKWKKEKKQ